MLRLVLTRRGFHELRNYSHFVASHISKRKIVGFLPASCAVCQRQGSIPSRHFNTGLPTRKDHIQLDVDETEESETADLDKWKSIMRAQAASEEKQPGDENAGETPGGDPKDSSIPQETRELVAMWRLAGKAVPKELTDEQLQDLAKLTSKASRKKFLKYLCIKENLKTVTKKKQQQKQERIELERQMTKEEDGDQEKQETGIPWGTAARHRFEAAVRWNCVQSMLFGQPLVFDMSYESIMTRREISNTVDQMKSVEAINRRSCNPFHLHYCNLLPDGAYMQEFQKMYGSLGWERLLVTTTDHQYVNVFPRDRLVYLTADSRKVLRKFDQSKVYIIGALVDRHIKPGLSLANAKRLNLETARLPLNEYLNWQIGAKNLTLDQMMSIMLSIRDTGKWEEALKFVPTRKHIGFHKATKHQEADFPQKDLYQKVGAFVGHRTNEDGDRQFRLKNTPSVSGGYENYGLIGQNKASVVSRKEKNKSSMDWSSNAGRSKLWKE